MNDRTKKRILVIEDDPDITSLLKYLLQDEGYDVITATDGAVGLEMAQNESPDLITLDIELPEINGFTICGILKVNEKYRSIPIIMLTARSARSDKIFDESVQPEAFITKPFMRDELLTKVKQFVS